MCRAIATAIRDAVLGAVPARAPTPDRKHPRERFLSLRGGNWYNATDYYVRIANRNGRLPETDHHNAGIRLVAAPAAR